MASTIAIGHVIQVRWEGFWEVGNTRWNNVQHFACVSAPSDEELDDYDVLSAIAENLFNLFDTHFLALASDKWEMRTCRAKRIAPTQSVFADYAALAAGGVSGEVDEPDDAAVVTTYTNEPGRRAQGRLYLGGLSDDVVENGELLEATAQAFTDAATAVLVDVIDLEANGEYRGVVWSPTEWAESANLTDSQAHIRRVFTDRIVRRQTRRDLKGRRPTGPTPSP